MEFCRMARGAHDHSQGLVQVVIYALNDTSGLRMSQAGLHCVQGWFEHP